MYKICLIKKRIIYAISLEIYIFHGKDSVTLV